jgi:hypothetical protein
MFKQLEMDFLLFYFQTCQGDLVRDNGHKYFLSILQDPSMPVSMQDSRQNLVVVVSSYVRIEREDT